MHRLPSSLFFRGGAPDALVQVFGANRSAPWAWRCSFPSIFVRAVAQFLSVCDALISHWLVPCGLVAGCNVEGARMWQLRTRRTFTCCGGLGFANMGRWFAARADLVYTAEHLCHRRGTRARGADGHRCCRICLARRRTAGDPVQTGPVSSNAAVFGSAGSGSKVFRCCSALRRLATWTSS